LNTIFLNSVSPTVTAGGKPGKLANVTRKDSLLDEQLTCAEGCVFTARLLEILVPAHLKLTQDI